MTVSSKRTKKKKTNFFYKDANFNFSGRKKHLNILCRLIIFWQNIESGKERERERQKVAQFFNRDFSFSDISEYESHFFSESTSVSRFIPKKAYIQIKKFFLPFQM